MSETVQKTRKAFLELLALFIIMLIAFVVYGLKQEPIAMGEELKQFGLKSLLEAKEEELIIQDTIAEVVQDNTQTEVKQDSSSKYILLLGDSMVEELQFKLREYAQFNGHRLLTCIWYNSTTKTWVEKKALTTLIKEYKPDVLFLELGGNETTLYQPKSREKYVVKLAEDLKDSAVPFIWIGPPNWNGDTGINEMIEKYIGKEQFFYSGALEEKLKGHRKKDGAHPTRTGGDIWAKAFAKWLRENSSLRHKILFQNPGSKTAIHKEYQPKQNVCRREVEKNTRVYWPKDKVFSCPKTIIPDSTKIQ